MTRRACILRRLNFGGDLVCRLAGDDFRQAWDKVFGAILPVGYVLREACGDRWARFHSLPDAKRFSQTNGEDRLVLGRANQLACDMFGTKNSVWLCVLGTGSYAREQRLPVAFSAPLDAQSDDAFVMPFHACVVDWKSGAFDDLFLAIAEDRERALFFDPDCGRVMAPYDGGFDLIWEDVAQMVASKQTHIDWLPDNSEGL